MCNKAPGATHKTAVPTFHTSTVAGAYFCYVSSGVLPAVGPVTNDTRRKNAHTRAFLDLNLRPVVKHKEGTL